MGNQSINDGLLIIVNAVLKYQHLGVDNADIDKPDWMEVFQ